jgi:tryptophan-rich sensory protein
MDVHMSSSVRADRGDRIASRPLWPAALLFAAGSLAAAVLGSVATSGTTDSAWFRALDKPAWYPPDQAFGIVWSILYVMIAVAGALAWRSGAPRAAIVAWWVQMGLNLGWSVIFFGLRRPGWALAEIVVLLAAIVVTIVLTRPADGRAAALLVPYAAWVAFATSLNAAIVMAA